MTRQPSRAVLRRPRHVLLAAAVAASLLTVSACSGSSGDGGASDGASSAYGFDAVKQDPSAPITVWVDASRQPAVDAFEKAYPDVKLKVETYDGGADGSGSFQTKIEAFNQAGSGWPDVVFSTQNNDAAWASQGTDPFAAPVDKGLFDKTFLDGFTQGALAPLTVDGTVYGLRNDLAPTVTWYDKALMDQWLSAWVPRCLVAARELSPIWSQPDAKPPRFEDGLDRAKSRFSGILSDLSLNNPKELTQ